MKKLGILGGMGPLATAEFYKMLVESTPATSDQEHIPIIIYADPTIPDRTQCILNNTPDILLEKLLFGIKTLESANVDYIVIPCNTIHTFVNEIKHKIKTPIIDFVDTTGQYLFNQKINEVCLFATLGTYQTNLYQKALKKYNVNVNVPTEETKAHVMSLILNVKQNTQTPEDLTLFKQLLNDTKPAIILGCTELSVLYSKLGNYNNSNIIDPMLVTIDTIINKFYKT